MSAHGATIPSIDPLATLHQQESTMAKKSVRRAAEADREVRGAAKAARKPRGAAAGPGEPWSELLYQGLETELGGVELYRAALRCAVDEELSEEWQKYLAQTENHVRVLQDVCAELELDPDRETPGRLVVRHIGKSLVSAIHMALGADDPRAAQIVAAECVVLAETKDHLNWKLIGKLVEEGPAAVADALRSAHEEVENEEDEHLYHSTGWTRELWLQSLGIKAVLPPPEEQKNVTTAIGAARAKNARDEMASS